MKFNAFFTRGSKASLAGQVAVMNQIGRAQATPANYENFSKEGYGKNPIVFKCITTFAQACGGIEWVLYKSRTGTAERREVEVHPLLDLLLKPNPLQAQSSFIEAIVAYRLISGNAYIEGVSPDSGQGFGEMWVLRPDMMKIIPGAMGVPVAYEFSSASGKVQFPVDILGRSSICHIKTFNPVNAWYGMSAIEAAMYSVDQHNESASHNLALLCNGGVPSGFMKVESTPNNPSGKLADDQRLLLEEQLRKRVTGSQNAGRSMVLEAGISWTQMGMNSRDMNWLEGRKGAAREIALVFGVPSQILGIPGDNTYSNYKEARQAFYEDTVIPFMDHLRDEWNRWLVPRFGDGLFLDYDRDSIEALVEKRIALYSVLQGTQFLSVNEKRAVVGYEKEESGDVILVPNNLVRLQDAAAEPVPATVPPAPQPAADGTQTPAEEQNAPDEAQNDTADQPDAQGQHQDENQQDPPEDQGKNVVEDLEHKLLLEDDDEVATKQVNLITGDDKARAWRSVNRRRVGLQKAFELDMKDELKAQTKSIVNAVKAAGTSPHFQEYAVMHAVGEHSKAIEATIKKHVARTVNEFGGRILSQAKSFGLPPDAEQKTERRFNDFAAAFAEKRAEDAANQVQQTTLKRTQAKVKRITSEVLSEEGVNHDEIASRLEEELGGEVGDRASMIARTETAIASNQGALEGAKALDVPDLSKEWISVGDDRTRDDHVDANGQKVGLDESFSVGGNPMSSPGDPDAPIDETINCRCVMGFSRAK